jgi:hypothetical protein
MSKEFVNYKNDNAIVVSRSPVFKRKKNAAKIFGNSIVINAIHANPGNKIVGRTLRNSVVNNIESINKVLTESNKILPYKIK